jgi:hypothetical protein
VPTSFPLVGRQPGWNQKSFGYHGDDGRFYRQTTRVSLAWTGFEWAWGDVD